MTLQARLVQRIKHAGPMSVADYMSECLLDPDYGYYSTRDPLGLSGDFTTAPEISQMFGELIGLALAQSWLDQNSPPEFTLAELGPGRGTLMADILRATRRIPGFHDAAHIWLVEASPTLRATQSSRLRAFSPSWADTVSDLPQDRPLYVIANEFFDALPVQQFVRDRDGWRERQIGVQDGSLRFGLGDRLPQPALAHRLDDTKDGDLVELCDPAYLVVAEIAARITSQNGVALIIDYGDWRSLGDTLQALKNHTPCDPLSDPGGADLTAHVDFEALAAQAIAAGLSHSRLTPQGVFLERLGITDRARALAAPLSGPALDSHIAAHRRLTHPEEMGNLFKVLGLFPAQGHPPPGLNA